MSTTSEESFSTEIVFNRCLQTDRLGWRTPERTLFQDKYSVKVSTTVRAMESLRPAWRNWAHSPSTDFDYYLYRLAHDSKSVRPYIITVYKNGTPAGMLIGQIRTQRATAVVSSINISGPRMRVLEIEKGGRMGMPSQTVDMLLAQELLKTVRGGGVDSICFERMPLQSGLFREMHRLAGPLIDQRVPHVFRYSELSLAFSSGTNQPSIFSPKLRHEIRRKSRNLERAHPGQIDFKCYSRPEEVDTALRDSLSVAATAWQCQLSQGLSDSPLTRATLRYLAERGWLRVFVLYVRDIPRAFLVGQVYDRTFACQYTGFDPSFASFSVGSILTARAFEQLAASGVRSVDLGEGGEEHNRRLGCEEQEEGTVHVYSPTFRGLLLNLFFGSLQAVRIGGRGMRRTLHLEWMAKRWTRFRLHTSA